MVREHREQVRVVRDGDLQRRERVVEHAPSMQNVILSRISKLLWLIATLFAALLSFRFVLLLIAANPGNSFAQFIYNITNPLTRPFAGLIATPDLGQGSVIDVAALFAIIVTILLTWVIVSLLQILFAEPVGTRQVTTIQQDSM